MPATVQMQRKPDSATRLIYNEIVLDPSERKISFFRITDCGGKEVFKKWDEFDNKIAY